MENTNYKVKWEIDIDASSPQEAAWLALQIQRDRESEAVAFDVETESTGEETFIDLIDKEDPRIIKIKSVIEEYGDFSTCDVDADSSPPIVNSGGSFISLAEDFYSDKVTVYNYNGSREDYQYDVIYEELPDSTIDSIVDLVDEWNERNLKDEI